jgi:tagatose 6-phosphate kinase
VALMPDDDRPRFERYLDRLGIDRLFYPVEGSTRISCTVLEQRLSQVTHLAGESMRLSPRIEEEFVAFCRTHMHPEDAWVLAGSLPRGLGHDTYRRLTQMCKAEGLPVLLDSRGKALSMGVRAKPTMIKPNHSELEGYFGEQILGVHHIALKGKRFLDMGIEYVFISLGADGMIAVHENECLLCSAPQVDAVDTVGCGDALDAGVMVAHMRKFSFPELCRMAVACGASNALHPGAGNIDRDEVSRLMEEVRIEAI